MSLYYLQGNCKSQANEKKENDLCKTLDSFKLSPLKAKRIDYKAKLAANRKLDFQEQAINSEM